MDALGYIDCGDNREFVLFPWIHEKVRSKGPVAVLDFGCGDARFAVALSKQIDAGVWAYDRDAAIREQARARITAEDAQVSLCESPQADWSGKFDVIVLLGVWMCWRTHAECVETLTLLRASLRPGGILIAAVTHPCFRDRGFETYRTDFDTSKRYLANGTPFHVKVGEPGKEIEIEDYHWNLEAMVAQTSEAGLVIAELKEHSDGKSGELPSWLSVVLSPRTSYDAARV